MRYGGKRAVRVSMTITAVLLAIIVVIVVSYIGEQEQEKVLYGIGWCPKAALVRLNVLGE